jgi:hypothetical protein
MTGSFDVLVDLISPLSPSLETLAINDWNNYTPTYTKYCSPLTSLRHFTSLTQVIIPYAALLITQYHHRDRRARVCFPLI